MIVFSQKEHFTGGKGRLRVIKVTASTPEEWSALLSAAQAADMPGMWWAESPSQERPWGAKDRRQVVVWARPAVVERLVASCGATAVPETYWQLCAGVLRMEFWKLWCRAETGDQEMWAHWRARLRWLAGQVYRSGEFVEDVEAWDGGEQLVDFGYEESRAAAAVKEWNGWIENFDLAQRRRVKPRSKEENRIFMLDGKRMRITREMAIRDDQLRYATMSKEALEEEISAKPWMEGLLRSWSVLWEGGHVHLESQKVLWLTEENSSTPRS